MDVGAQPSHRAADPGEVTVACYSITCELGIERYDDPRMGRAAAGAAALELARLCHDQELVQRTRLRRRSGSSMELSVELRAADAAEALTVGGGLLRCALHATGTSTAGWELIRPRAVQRRRWLRQRRSPAPAGAVAPPLGWASATEVARRRALPARPLPALHGIGDETLIDLR